jgi:hypothetical protein
MKEDYIFILLQRTTWNFKKERNCSQIIHAHNKVIAFHFEIVNTVENNLTTKILENINVMQLEKLAPSAYVMKLSRTSSKNGKADNFQ